jgi:hypothetical protein
MIKSHAKWWSLDDHGDDSDDDHKVIKGLLGEEKRQNPMELKAKV